MDPRDSPEQAAFRADVRRWLSENVPGDWDRSDRARLGRQWHRRLHRAGFVGLSWPAEFGGRGLGPAMQFIWQEEYSRAKAPPMLNVIGLGWAGPAIMLHGSPEQKSRYLPKILSGDEIWCQLFSEPGAGSDLAGLTTRAEPADGGFVLNGQKVWTSVAAEADLGLCVARTDPSASRHAGISMLIVDMHQPGVEVRPIRQMNGAADFSEVFLTDVHAGPDALIGPLNGGWAVTITTLMHERIGLSAGGGSLWGQGPGTADLGALASSTESWTGSRRQDLAQVCVDAFAHRALKLRLVTQAARGGQPGAEASVQKLFGDEWGQRLNGLAVDCLGPQGLLDGPWASSFLYSPALTIGGGTTQVQKNIIGERILGLPKEGPAKP
ncbi:MAG TPA: acyl-CoA dehydrogenase family protein [Actinomycetota bacterium]|nr:acyl-CoA dehydrogenase family protein [Actinomycetota bacterium]